MTKQEVATAKYDEVVKLKETGLSYAEIARRLVVSPEWARRVTKVKLQQKPDLQSKVMLSTGEVAHLLGLHINTVRHWSQKGILKSHRTGPRGDRRFSREDIDGFLKRGSQATGLRDPECGRSLSPLVFLRQGAREIMAGL